jgi:iron(III) transport system ATP-binding protein
MNALRISAPAWGPDDAPRATVLEVAGLTKCYPGGTCAAVNDVSFTVHAGEILAFVGESGCGKTTLLRLIAGLETPDRGWVRLQEREVAGPRTWLPPERRGIGMVFQDFALFPHLRVADNVAYGLNGMPRRERRARVEELLELVGLSGVGQRYPHQLSGGQQQRVALARALAPEPGLILFDEPFSNLDVALKAAIRDELGDILRRTGATALIVVHDSEDVMALADRVAVMRKGVVLQLDTPSVVYRRPWDEYVARFFGETNVLCATCIGSGYETPLGFVPSRSTNGARGPVNVSIRPEGLELSREPGRGQPAVVRRVRHHGVHQRALLSVGDGPPVRINVPAEWTLAPGDIVYVRVRADAVQVLEVEV